MSCRGSIALLRWWMWDFLSYRNLRFHTIKTLRESVPRHILFYVTERDKAIRYQLAKHLSEDASLIRMEFSKRAWYTQLNKTK